MTGPLPADRGATVSALLLQPELRGASVKAGAAGADRRLSWIARVSGPEDAVPVGPGDLVLLSSPEAPVRLGPGFVRRIAGRGAAAVVLGEAAADAGMEAWLEAGARAEADEEALPIIALPRGSGYRELSRAVASIAFGLPGGAVSGSPEPGRTPDSAGRSRAESDPAGGTRTDSDQAAKPRTAPDLLAALARGDPGPLTRACAGPRLKGEKDWPRLRDAVESFLRHGGNAVAASTELGVHRHTIRARLRRYEALSGLSLEDGDSRIAVTLAFRLEDPGVGETTDG